MGPTRCRATPALNQSADEIRTPEMEVVVEEEFQEEEEEEEEIIIQNLTLTGRDSGTSMLSRNAVFNPCRSWCKAQTL